MHPLHIPNPQVQMQLNRQSPQEERLHHNPLHHLVQGLQRLFPSHLFFIILSHPHRSPRLIQQVVFLLRQLLAPHSPRLAPCRAYLAYRNDILPTRMCRHIQVASIGILTVFRFLQALTLLVTRYLVVDLRRSQGTQASHSTRIRTRQVICHRDHATAAFQRIQDRHQHLLSGILTSHNPTLQQSLDRLLFNDHLAPHQPSMGRRRREEANLMLTA